MEWKNVLYPNIAHLFRLVNIVFNYLLNLLKKNLFLN